MRSYYEVSQSLLTVGFSITFLLRSTQAFNVDASFLEDTNYAWVGFVARNDLGQVIIAGARQIQKCLNAEEAETRACAVGLQAVARVTQNPVFLESDNATVVATIKKLKPISWSALEEL
jgi:ribonuclease HI